jgi:hypothetical protein
VHAIIQHRPFIQTVDPIDCLFAIQAPGDPGIIPVCHLPTQPLGQILGKLIFGMSYRPPLSADAVSAIEESGHRIKASSYVGISVNVVESDEPGR